LIYYCKAFADRLADTRVNRLQELQSCGAHQLRNRGARIRTNFLLPNEGKIFVARPNKRVNTMRSYRVSSIFFDGKSFLEKRAANGARMPGRPDLKIPRQSYLQKSNSTALMKFGFFPEAEATRRVGCNPILAAPARIPDLTHLTEVLYQFL